MTHATKAIYRWLLSDFIKVSNIATEQMLYSERDLETSMEKIETINFHEEKECIDRCIFRLSRSLKMFQPLKWRTKL